MLKEIEETGNLANPYCLSGAEVEQRMAEIRQRMTEIKTSIETVWTKSQTVSDTTVEFRDRTVATSDLTSVSSTITTVSFIGCHSKEWAEIGKRLATLSQLTTLTVEHCDSEDSLCEGVYSSKSLASVRMSK
jgi:hypothetical protein